MRRIHTERMTARVEGEAVVYLIGMRINRDWKAVREHADVNG